MERKTDSEMGEARAKPEMGAEGQLEIQKDRDGKKQTKSGDEETQKGQPAKEVVGKAKMGGKLW